jgi:hypothetical protein
VLPFSGLWYLEVHLAIDFAKYQSRVLRCCTESETHANTFSDPNRDSYCYAPVTPRPRPTPQPRPTP